MNIPDKFIMAGHSIEYEMIKRGDGEYNCIVATEGYSKGYTHGPYNKTEVEDFLTTGGFKIKEDLSKYNGVDADGNPLNFTPDQLKPFMRVKVGCGYEYIVVTLADGALHLIREDEGHNTPRFSNHEDEFAIIEVYEQPVWDYKTLTFGARGNLIWKRKVKSEKEEKLEQLSDEIEKAQQALADLKDKYDAVLECQ